LERNGGFLAELRGVLEGLANSEETIVDVHLFYVASNTLEINAKRFSVKKHRSFDFALFEVLAQNKGI
jgi:hypothetical protein